MPLTRVLRLALHRFDALTDALTQYGQERLGCRTISPPWLSFYIDGCERQVQADSRHLRRGFRAAVSPIALARRSML